MSGVGTFLLRHGYLLLFLASLVEQLGVPLPSTPLLVAAGALARTGGMSAAGCIALAVLASMLGHLVWYEAGRRRGASVLRLVCRISIEPDSCVRRTEDLFSKHGARSLVAAPFIPGLGMVAPPLAGMAGMGVLRFLFFDALGALLWAVAFVALGYAAGPELKEWLEPLARLGGALIGLLVAALALWVLWKLLQRNAHFRALRMPRISPVELKALFDAGGGVTVIDLRGPIDVQANPAVIPGALVMAFEELEKRRDELPREQEIILYCD